MNVHETWHGHTFLPQDELLNVFILIKLGVFSADNRTPPALVVMHIVKYKLSLEKPALVCLE